MDQIKLQVKRARRRLIIEQFLKVVGWSLFAALVVASIGLAVAKIWVLPVDALTWTWSWIGGAIAAGLLVAVITTYVLRRGAIEAALEIDRRFGLKERVSSTMALGPQDADTEIGRALIEDAVRRVSEIDVRDQFRVRTPWTISLPLLPAIFVFVLAMFVPNAMKDKASQASAAAPRSIVKKEADKLRQQLQKKRAELKEKGLSEAEQLLDELEKGVEELQKKDDIDRKKAMIKINDLAKMIKDRQKQLAGSDEIRNQMERLKDIQKGPADDLTKALKEGDFQAAAEEINKLKEQLNQGELSAEKQEELAQQLAEMQKKLEEANQAYQDAKQQLEEQIKEKMRSGDLAGANDLQKQLDQLNSMSNQMNQLSQMSQKLGEACKACQSGQSQQAAQALGEIAQSLEQLQSELEQLESLDEMLDQLADAKEGMGDGDSMSSDSMFSQLGQSIGSSDGPPGMGLGEGQGFGDRPEESTDTQHYDSQVQGKLQKGKAALIGHVDGPNVKGETREDAKAAILSSMNENSDPLSDAQLPRDQRDHAREYFQKYRD